MLAAAPSIRIISCSSVGYDHVDVTAATSAGTTTNGRAMLRFKRGRATYSSRRFLSGLLAFGEDLVDLAARAIEDVAYLLP